MNKTKHKRARKGMTLLMAVALAFGMVPAVPATALADTESGESGDLAIEDVIPDDEMPLGKTIYVDPNLSSDEDDSASDDTVRTFAEAIEMAGEGDVIVLMGDVGDTIKGINKSVTIKGYGTTPVQVSGSVELPKGVSYLKLENLKFSNANSISASDGDSNVGSDNGEVVGCDSSATDDSGLSLVIQNCVFDSANGGTFIDIESKIMALAILNCSFGVSNTDAYHNEYMVRTLSAEAIVVLSSSFDGKGVAKAPIYLGNKGCSTTDAYIIGNSIVGFERGVQLALQNNLVDQNAEHRIRIAGNTFKDITLSDLSGSLPGEVGAVFVDESQGDRTTVVYEGNALSGRTSRAIVSDSTTVSVDEIFVWRADGSQEPDQESLEKNSFSTYQFQVGESKFKSFEDVLQTANGTEDKTIYILEDVDANVWNQVWNLQGITIDGKGHTLSVRAIESLENADAIFHSAGNNVFKNLTFDLSDVSKASAAQGSRAIAAMDGDVISNVKFIGPENNEVSYGVTVSASGAEGQGSVLIDRCEFVGFPYAVYDVENEAVDSLTIANSDIADCDYAVILRSENGVFTGNTVDDGKLNIMQSTQRVEGNSFTGASRVKFYAALLEGHFSRNKISESSYLDADSAVETVDVSKNYWGGSAPSVSQLGNVKTVGANVYFVSETMRDPYDLNTYVPPAPAPSEPEGEVTENPDGSTTTTVTEEKENADGSTVTTVTETTEGREDGSVTEKVTETTVSEDGTKTEKVTETSTLKDGTSATTVTVDGELASVEATVTEAAVESAAGKAVELPMAPVEAASSEKAVEVKVEAPAGAKVAVPVAKAEGSSSVAPGAVLVLVDAEGNETVLPKTANTGGALSAEIPGDCTLKVVDASADFPDVASGDWYEEQGVADFVSARGIMTGVETETGAEFQGDVATNRGMFVTMLNRLEMEAKASSGEGFADVPEGSWYEDSSAWAVEAGIATGYENADGSFTFDGEGFVTREQMATFLFRYAQWLGLDTDARAEREIEGVSDFAEDAVSWAVAEGLIKGDDETGAIRPTDGATRAEAAAVVMRMVDLMA